MKKCILLPLAVCLLLSGCSTTLMGNSGKIPYETFGELDLNGTPSLHQASLCAQNLIQLGAYEEAYAIYQRLSDQSPEAAAEAARFLWLKDTLVRTDTYVNGELTKSEKAVYDSAGELIVLSEVRLLLDRTWSVDPNYVLSEIWQYDSLVEQTATTAPYTLEFIYDPDGVVLTLTRAPVIPSNISGLAIGGYTVNYAYDSDGRISSETGVDRMHCVLSHDAPSTYELPFEGTYTYDDSGRLIRYDRSYTSVDGGFSWDAYTYDAAGNLLLHESGKEGDVFFNSPNRYESIVREYRYDEDGKKIFESTLTLRGENAESAQRDYTQTEYLYENGHLMKQTQTFEGTQTVNETLYTYDDLLVYIREQKEVTGDGSTTSEAGESE